MVKLKEHVYSVIQQTLTRSICMLGYIIHSYPLV